MMPRRECGWSRIGWVKLTPRLGTAKVGSRVSMKLHRSEFGDDTGSRLPFRRQIAMITCALGKYTMRIIEADSDSAPLNRVTEHTIGHSQASTPRNAGHSVRSCAMAWPQACLRLSSRSTRSA